MESLNETRKTHGIQQARRGATVRVPALFSVNMIGVCDWMARHCGVRHFDEPSVRSAGIDVEDDGDRHPGVDPPAILDAGFELPLADRAG